MNRLKEILEEKKITQTSVAEKLGITKQYVSIWAANVTDPNIENIKKICKVLNITSDELLGIDKRG